MDFLSFNFVVKKVSFKKIVRINVLHGKVVNFEKIGIAGLQ